MAGRQKLENVRVSHVGSGRLCPAWVNDSVAGGGTEEEGTGKDSTSHLHTCAFINWVFVISGMQIYCISPEYIIQ